MPEAPASPPPNSSASAPSNTAFIAAVWAPPSPISSARARASFSDSERASSGEPAARAYLSDSRAAEKNFFASGESALARASRRAARAFAEYSVFLA